jgi:hypothetical protein
VTIAVITLSLVLAGVVTALLFVIRSRDEQRVLAEGYRSDRDEGVRQLKVAADELAAERKLRVTAELQRNAVTAKLREQMAHLPPEEIEAEFKRVFGQPLSMTEGNELEKP